MQCVDRKALQHQLSCSCGAAQHTPDSSKRPCQPSLAPLLCERLQMTPRKIRSCNACRAAASRLTGCEWRCQQGCRFQRTHCHQHRSPSQAWLQLLPEACMCLRDPYQPADESHIYVWVTGQLDCQTCTSKATPQHHHSSPS